ncbi:MAG: S6e family ribosomal protein [Candidatus Nanohaloarchaea archaeon]|nr:S6e family ribosomal protein [Candidatus Nanohaloarchaea archaeon]
MQIVIGANDGKTHPVDIDGSQAQSLIGMKIGDQFSGSKVGLEGYELEITGGSDTEGFPMRKKLNSTGRKKVLVRDNSGKRSRQSFRGNTVSEAIAQLNCRVVEQGSKSLEELLGGSSEESEDTEESESDSQESEESQE